MKSPPGIVVYSPSITGGLAEHTYYQATALQKLGADVLCLVSPSFLSGRSLPFPVKACLADPPPPSGTRWLHRVRMGVRLLYNQLRLAWHVFRYRPSLVLLDSYAEYLSPCWVWPHIVLARLSRARYAANLHDPVRNYQVGPGWWHRLSVGLAYLPLDFVLVHDQLPESSPVPARVRTVQVSVGVYDLRPSPQSRDAIRQAWGATPEHRVFLAFGYVRDGKNLDLAIRALRQVRDAFLVIAGSVASAKDKPFGFYRELARQEGVADRVSFNEGFVSDEALGGYFAGADFVLLSYSSSFHSQSGVLNIAARARKPVLASAAPSPLIEMVSRYQLGVTVRPDSAEEIAAGMRSLLRDGCRPLWEDYEAFAAWGRNAAGILEAAGLRTAPSPALRAPSPQPMGRELPESESRALNP